MNLANSDNGNKGSFGGGVSLGSFNDSPRKGEKRDSDVKRPETKDFLDTSDFGAPKSDGDDAESNDSQDKEM